MFPRSSENATFCCCLSVFLHVMVHLRLQLCEAAFDNDKIVQINR